MKCCAFPGQPLDAQTRAFMEPRFGHDFGHVRVHTDAKATESARAVDALAYTVGQEVVFSAGRYAPTSFEGSRLLAHELVHVIQQRGQNEISHVEFDREDHRFESEADRMAAKILQFVPGKPAIETKQTSRPHLLRQASRRQAGIREATIRVAWSEDDQVFSERLVRAVARSGGFRGITANDLRAMGSRDPGEATEQKVKAVAKILKITGWAVKNPGFGEKIRPWVIKKGGSFNLASGQKQGTS